MQARDQLDDVSAGYFQHHPIAVVVKVGVHKPINDQSADGAAPSLNVESAGGAGILPRP